MNKSGKAAESKSSVLLNGVLKENPVLVLLLGTCPTLAVTTQAVNGIGMGLATTAVLICSNAVISILKNIISDRVRIPCFIIIIAGFVTIVGMIMEAYVPSLYAALGLFIPLIVVNCIVLGRAEMFASRKGVFLSVLDGLGMGIGFTLALFVMGSVREILGAKSWMGMEFLPENLPEASIFLLAPGGFFVFGILVALARKAPARGVKFKDEFACEGCEGCAEAAGADGSADTSGAVGAAGIAGAAAAAGAAGIAGAAAGAGAREGGGK